MEKALFLFAWILAAFSAHAQVKARLEFPYKEDIRSYRVIPMEDNGVLLATISDKVSDGGRMLKLSHYDTSLRLLASDSSKVGRDLDFHEHMYDNGRCLIALREMGRALLGPRRVNGDGIAVVTYTPPTRKMDVVTGEYPENATMA